MKVTDIISKIINTINNIFKISLYLTAAITFLFVMLKTFSKNVVIDQISIPADISNKIITEKGVANKLVDKINYIARIANKQAYEGAFIAYSQKPYDIDNSSFSLEIEHDKNQIYLPGGNTLDGYIEFLRKLFGIKTNKVSGEIYSKGNAYFMSFSIIGAKGNVVKDVKIDINDMDKALLTVAEQILLFNDPHLLAKYYIHADKTKFIDIIDVVVSNEVGSVKQNALNTYGLYYWIKDKYYESINKFNLSLKVMENAYAYYGLSKCYYSLKEYDKAIDMANKMILLKPNNSEAYVIKGQCLHRKYKFDEAIKEYQLAININQKNANAYFYWGITLLHPSIENVTEAIEILKKATSIDNTYLPAHVQLAANSYKLQRYDDALHHLKEASKIDPTFERSYKAVYQEYDAYNEKMINEALKNKVDMSTTNSHYNDFNYLDDSLLKGDSLIVLTTRTHSPNRIQACN